VVVRFVRIARTQRLDYDGFIYEFYLFEGLGKNSQPQPSARCPLARPERKPKKEEDLCVEENGKKRPKSEEEPLARLPQSVHVQIGRIRPISDRHPHLVSNPRMLSVRAVYVLSSKQLR
jgi:hypothetical protein